MWSYTVSIEKSPASRQRCRGKTPDWSRHPMDSIPTKRCSKCGLELPATRESFHRNATSKDGLSCTCKECAKERARQWYKDNTQRGIDNAAKWRNEHRERRNELSRAAYARNLEHCRERDRALYWRDPERARERSRAQYRSDLVRNRERGRIWAAANRDRHRDEIRARERARYHENLEESRMKGRLHVARRRAWKLASGGDHTKADILKQYEAQDGLCWWCGAELNGKYHADHRIPLAKGGSNAPENICLTCPDCNRKKGDRMPYEFNGRLL